MLFAIENKWKNTFLLLIYFSCIFLLWELTHGFSLLFAFAIGNKIAPNLGGEQNYVNETELEEYSTSYGYGVYGVVLSFLFIFFGFAEEKKITLDIIFFLIRFMGAVLFWYTVCFIPISGKVEGFKLLINYIVMFISLMFVVGTLGWVLSSVEGWSLLSKAIWVPIEAVYALLPN